MEAAKGNKRGRFDPALIRNAFLGSEDQSWKTAKDIAFFCDARTQEVNAWLYSQEGRKSMQQTVKTSASGRSKTYWMPKSPQVSSVPSSVQSSSSSCPVTYWVYIDLTNVQNCVEAIVSWRHLVHRFFFFSTPATFFIQPQPEEDRISLINFSGGGQGAVPVRMMATVVHHCCTWIDREKRGVIIVSKSKLFDSFPGVCFDELKVGDVHVVQDLDGLIQLLRP